jgi:hypothetical protein
VAERDRRKSRRADESEYDPLKRCDELSRQVRAMLPDDASDPAAVWGSRCVTSQRFFFSIARIWRGWGPLRVASSPSAGVWYTRELRFRSPHGLRLTYWRVESEH